MEIIEAQLCMGSLSQQELHKAWRVGPFGCGLENIELGCLVHGERLFMDETHQVVTVFRCCFHLILNNCTTNGIIVP